MIKLFYSIIISCIPIPVMAADSGGSDITSVQWLLNAAFTIVGVLGGWLMHLLHECMRDLQKTDSELADKVHLIEVLVAGQYVKKDELEKLSSALFAKLDKIDQRLDKMAYREV